MSDKRLRKHYPIGSAADAFVRFVAGAVVGVLFGVVLFFGACVLPDWLAADYW